jgi:ribonuclease E
MLINHVHGEESRIAITADGKLEELYTERVSADLHVGNIYRGRVTNTEPSIQAAFVDFGESRSGFLHITDLHPRYFAGPHHEETEKVGEKTPRRDRPPIQRCLRRGQEILVQVLKEGIGSKGPTLTSYLSIPGRYLVMMPYMERHGVSRKVDDPEKRRAMRQILDDLDPPEDFGFIVRTAGLGRNKTELKRDLNYLLRLWKNIEVKMKSGRGPSLLYTESDLVIRTLRDVMTSDVKRIILDDRHAALRAKEFIRVATPRSTVKVLHYSGTTPLFDAFDVERQIQVISQRHVPMPNGGSLVFDQAEAMVAIDVNSGKFRDQSDPEETAYRTNLDAVDEIARQLRLRDLGGIIVLDLIDMYVHRHRREVERRFRDALKNDRARIKLTKISELGLLEMTRQRMRPSLGKSVYNDCPSCRGTGHILSPESVVLEIMRRLAVALDMPKTISVQLTVHPTVLAVLLNRKRKAITSLEKTTGKAIDFRADVYFATSQFEIVCLDARDQPVDIGILPRPKPPVFTDADEIKATNLAELDDLIDLEMDEDAEDQAGSESPEAVTEAAAGTEAPPPALVAAVAPSRVRGPRPVAPTPPPRPVVVAVTKARDDEDLGDEEGEGDGEGEERAGTETAEGEAGDEPGRKKRRRRRRGRRRRGGRGGEAGAEGGSDMAEGSDTPSESAVDAEDAPPEPAPVVQRRLRLQDIQKQPDVEPAAAREDVEYDHDEGSESSESSESDSGGDDETDGGTDGGTEGNPEGLTADGQPRKRRRRRRGGRRHRRKNGGSGDGSGEGNGGGPSGGNPGNGPNGNGNGNGNGNNRGNGGGGNAGPKPPRGGPTGGPSRGPTGGPPRGPSSGPSGGRSNPPGPSSRGYERG